MRIGEAARHFSEFSGFGVPKHTGLIGPNAAPVVAFRHSAELRIWHDISMIIPAMCQVLGAMLVVALALPQAAHPQVPACAGQDCDVAVPARHAVTKLEYWKAALARPVEERIGPADAEMLDYLIQDNIRNSVPNRPRPAVLTPDFLADVHKALGELPVQVKRFLSGRLAGIQFAEDIGGTGYAEEIVDADSNPAAGFIVFDSAILSRQTANAWFTWKENTPFKPQPGFELLGEIEAKSDDNRKYAIQYILLHELAHVISIGGKIHPPWTTEPRDIQSAAEYPYLSLSWLVEKENNRYATLFDRKFAQRKNVVFYLGAKLSGEHMVDIYDKLEATNFPTLYAVTNPFDDWAEAFVTYVHTVMMNKPFGIRIFQDGKLVKDYKSCWAEKRCEEKRKILERFLAGR
jgi:hypothetical protein